jgi:hypothetical protein
LRKEQLMTRLRIRVLGSIGIACLAGGLVLAMPASADEPQAKHVLLLSVDGLHQSPSWSPAIPSAITRPTRVP